jgi:predicted nuclease of predicted toxin-antitoxin system
MWLLDHNVPVQLRELLVEFGIEADTAFARGWQTLRNGDLVATAMRDGFRVLLTRDTKFAEAARSALKHQSDLAVIVVRLPQRRWRSYEVEFRRAWAVKRIEPIAGQVIEWP